MASSFVGSAAGETNKKFNNASPKNIKKPWSPRSDQGHQAGSAPHMCVCAPATHAGSFKCRLHRVNSHGHSPRSPTLHQQAAVSAPSSNTVTAQ